MISFRQALAVAAFVATCFSFAAGAAPADGKPWPAPVEGWKKPEPGEHPRLFFRKSDLPEIKKRAETPEGKVIVARLRQLLNGSDGQTLPAKFHDTKADGGELKGGPGEVMTLWHPAGYGMLYQLTGDRKYADLGRQCTEKILAGTRDRDARYSFVNANGALRAGPSLGAMAMGYDLCYDGWDDDFRRTVAAAMAKGTAGDKGFPLDGLVVGVRLGVKSNHGGCQIGGGALAVLALWGDPGVADNARIEKLMEESKRTIVKQFTEGFGDGGMFWEGKGPGGIASDTALIPAVQAWRVAGGQDFVNPRPNVPAVTLIKVHELMTIGGEPWYPIDKPSSYGYGYFGPAAKGSLGSDRDGLSRAAQFAQGFGAIPDKLKPAALWAYHHVAEPDPAKRTYDTVSLYPHRPVLALVNWPLGVKEVNPAEVLPRVHHDSKFRLYSFRNQWTGTEDDVVTTMVFGSRDAHPVMVWGRGRKVQFGTCPQGAVTHFQPAEDGSGTVTAGGMAVGVDYSKASGADALIVVTGRGANAKGGGVKQVQVGGNNFQFVALGKDVEPRVEEDKIMAGGQTITFDGKKIVFATMAGPPKLPRMGCW